MTIANIFIGIFIIVLFSSVGLSTIAEIIELLKIPYLRIKNEIAFKSWLKNSEEIYREDNSLSGYPTDWQFRRLYVYLKQKGICSCCGRRIGKLSLWSRQLCYGKYGEISPTLRFIHLHHKIPISQGGKHDLSNLEVICELCHCKKHPNNTLLKSNRY